MPGASIAGPGPDRLRVVICGVLFIAVAFPLRVDYPIGPFRTVSVLDVAVVLGALYLAVRFLCMSPIHAGPSTLAIAVLAPAFVAVFSASWAVDEVVSATAAAKYLYGALVYVVAYQFGASLPRAAFAQVTSAILLGWLIGSLAMYLGIKGFEYFLPAALDLSHGELLDLAASVYTRLGHPFIGQSNDFGPLLALLAFALLGHARLDGTKVHGALCGIALFACVLTFSRGLLVGLILALCVYAVATRVSAKHVLLAGLIVAVAVAVAGFSLSNTSIVLEDRELALADVVASRLSDVNLQLRLEGYAETLRQIGERPFLGYGVGYFDRSAAVSLVAVHNSLLEQWKYFGVFLGTVVFLCYAAVMLHFFRLARSNSQTSHLTYAIACAWLCLLVASMVETFFEATVPRAIIFLLLGLYAARCAPAMKPGWLDVEPQPGSRSQ